MDNYKTHLDSYEAKIKGLEDKVRNILALKEEANALIAKVSNLINRDERTNYENSLKDAEKASNLSINMEELQKKIEAEQAALTRDLGVSMDDGKEEVEMDFIQAQTLSLRIK